MKIHDSASEFSPYGFSVLIPNGIGDVLDDQRLQFAADPDAVVDGDVVGIFAEGTSLAFPSLDSMSEANRTRLIGRILIQEENNRQSITRVFRNT